MQQIKPVFIVRQQLVALRWMAKHDVGPKTVHADRRMTSGHQLVIELVERCFADDQQRIAIAELVGRLNAVRPLQAAQAFSLRVKAHQARRHAQKISEPLRGNPPHVIGGHFVIPDLYPHRRFDLVQRNVQGQHAGRAQHHLEMLELGLNQRHARKFALREEMAVCVHHHPGAVKFQPGFQQQRLLHFNAGARFHRIHIQPGNHGDQIGRHFHRRATHRSRLNFVH